MSQSALPRQSYTYSCRLGYGDLSCQYVVVFNRHSVHLRGCCSLAYSEEMRFAIYVWMYIILTTYKIQVRYFNAGEHGGQHQEQHLGCSPAPATTRYPFNKVGTASM